MKLRILITVLLICGSVVTVRAQVNSWTKPTSGNWEEMYWSLGVRPASDHRVMITNAGWKAVQVAPSTVQSYPQSLNVYSINVSSPVDSFNTLLLNYAGFQVPLTVNYSLTVAPNSALTMFSSALHLGGPTGVGLSIGGEVNQNDSSQVTGNQGDVGWVGPGVYNLNSGVLQVGHFWVGGPHAGVFNQNGGSNLTGIVHLEPSAVYNLRGGDLTGEVYFTDNTVLRQDGGRLHQQLKMFRGQYLLNDGVNYGGVTVGVYAEYRNGNASAIQNGGTNFGPIQVGGEQGSGSYTLSNGVVEAPAIGVGLFGHFRQVNGTVTTPATIGVRGGYFDRGSVGPGYFSLDGGVLSSPGIHLNTATFGQSGGTNSVAGVLQVEPGTLSPSGNTAARIALPTN